MRVQELFSRNGLIRWLVKPCRRQSSCSCSLMNLTMSATACETSMRLMAASRRSCSVTARCCCKFEITMSINAVSERPMVANFTSHTRENHTQHGTLHLGAAFAQLLLGWQCTNTAELCCWRVLEENNTPDMISFVVLNWYEVCLMYSPVFKAGEWRIVCGEKQQAS